MKQTATGRTNILKGISTLDVIKRNLRTILFLIMCMAFGMTAFGEHRTLNELLTQTSNDGAFGVSASIGHSTLDVVDPSFNPQVTTNSFIPKAVSKIVALPNGKNLIAGNFNSFNRQPVGGLVRLNADATLDTTFNNFVLAPNSPGANFVLPQPDGKIIVGGCCFRLNGQTTSTVKFLRLTADGNIDPTFVADIGIADASFTPVFYDAAVDSSGRVLIVGKFRVDINGTLTTIKFLRLNSDGSRDTSVSINPLDSPIHIAIQNNKIIVYVSRSNGEGLPPTLLIQRLNADSSVDSTFNQKDLNGFVVQELIVQPDNKILSLDGQKLIRLNDNGTDDTSFQIPTFSFHANTMELMNDGRVNVFVSGSSSVPVSIQRFLSNGLPDSSFTTYSNTDNSYLLQGFASQPDGSMWLGDTVNGSTTSQIINGFKRLLPNGSVDPTFNSGGIGFQNANPGSVSAIAVQPDNKIIIGGIFNEVNNVLRYRLARLNADNSLDTSFSINFNGGGNYFSQISSISQITALSDGKILVSGSFYYYINGVAKLGVARLNPDGSIDPTFDYSSTFDGFLEISNRFVVQNDGKIVVGRNRVPNPPFPNLSTPLRVNPDGTQDFSFNPNIHSTKSVYVRAVKIQPDGKILVAGLWIVSSATTSPIFSSFITRINPDGSIDQAFQTNETLNKEISDLIVLPNGKILIAQKTFLGFNVPQSSSNVLRLNADGSIDNSFNSGTGTDDGINVMLLLPNGKILVGGKFTTYNGQPRQNLAQLNADGSLNPITYSLNDEVLSLEIDNQGRVLVGGSFTVISAGGSGANRSYIARLIDSRLKQTTRFDFDGDGQADLGVFNNASGVWSIRQSGINGIVSTHFGLSNDKTVPANFDGDGAADIAVYRPSEGVWYLLRSSDGFSAVRWGVAEDKPVAGDFDGDGKDDIAVWRPSSAVWYVQQSSNNQPYILKFGLTGDIPLQADFDGDGKSDIAVWRPSDGNFYWLASGSNNQFRVVHFGANGDIPSVADYNGDGKADLVVYRPTEGNWYQYLTTATGDYTFAVVRFGLNGDEPIVADYDGDTKTDIAVRRGNVWHILRSTQGYTAWVFANRDDWAIAALSVP
jgi:uncharacterized delta-60 repeat protein